MFQFEPICLVCDKHPDYLSSQFAESSDLPTIKIKHHHAHIASCMAEYGLDEKVIGVSFDGIGYGDDKNIWGGETLEWQIETPPIHENFHEIPVVKTDPYQYSMNEEKLVEEEVG